MIVLLLGRERKGVVCMFLAGRCVLYKWLAWGVACECVNEYVVVAVELFPCGRDGMHLFL